MIMCIYIYIYIYTYIMLLYSSIVCYIILYASAHSIAGRHKHV